MQKALKLKECIEAKANKLALKMVESSLESTCVWVFHQPKLSKEVKDAIKC